MATGNIRKITASFINLLIMKLGVKAFGLLSTLALARLLTPADFSIVAMGSITVQFCAVLAQAGSEQYLLQKRKVSENDLYSAWTIDFCLKIFIFIFLNLSCGYILEVFFSNFVENDTISVIRILSFVLILDSLRNPGVILLKKNFDYRKIVILQLSIKLVITFLVILAALITKSYWSIVLGDLLFSVMYMFGTYIIDNHRPRVSFKNIRKQFIFSKWVLLKGVIGYSRSQLDNFLTANMFGKESLGMYYLSRDIALLPASEVVFSLTEPFLASFSEYKDNVKYFARQVRIGLIAVLLIIFPCSMVIFLFSEKIIFFLLGEKWMAIAQPFSYFSLLLLGRGIGMVSGQALVSLAKVKSIFYFDIFTLVFLFSFFYFIEFENLATFSLCFSSLSLFCNIALFFILDYHVKMDKVRTFKIVSSVLFPFVLIGLFWFYYSNEMLFFSYHLTFGVFFIIIFVIFLYFYLLSLRKFDEIDYLYRIIFSFLRKFLSKF